MKIQLWLRIGLVLLLASAGAALLSAAHASAFGPAGDTASAAAGSGAGSTSFYTTTIAISTYPYERCLQTRWNGPYMYRKLDWACYGAPSPRSKNYTLWVLENDYLRVTVLPALGGRVYQMVDKAAGHNVLYQNPVLKPTPWGPPEQGWWLAAGGIEWCLPVDEHGYEWAEPWSASIVSSTAGVTVTVRDTAATNRLQAAVDLFLPADRGYLVVTPRLTNPTTSALPYKFWLNAALAPGPENRPTAGLQFIFNAAEMAVHSTGDKRLPGHYPTEPTAPNYRFNWPRHNNVDFSRLSNWREWLGFFEYPQAAADFIGVYNRDADAGVARVFPSSIARGAKGFAFGWSKPIPWSYWTDNGSGYVELHGGVMPTFWDTATLPAGATLTWSEYWYPLHSLGGLTTATAEAALGLEQDGGLLRIGVHSTAMRPWRSSTLYVWERSTCAELARRELPDVDPAHPFVAPVALGGRTLDQITVVYMDDAGQVLVALNPKDCLPPQAQVGPLPPFVETTSFTVAWSGEDVWQGVAAYDVQVRDGYGVAWNGWLTDTAAISATFTGAHGHTYFFRARARDQAGNRGAWTDEEWGQAVTTVLTDTAPVLATSHKTVWPALFSPGQTVLYTIIISNSGTLTAAATLTDTPPAAMLLLTATLAASSGPPPIGADGEVHWSGEVAPGGQISVSYLLSPTAATPLLAPMTNSVQIDGSVLGPLIRSSTAIQAHIARLPLVVRWW